MAAAQLKGNKREANRAVFLFVACSDICVFDLCVLCESSLLRRWIDCVIYAVNYSVIVVVDNV